GQGGWGLGARVPPKLPPAPRLAVSQPSGTTASHQPLQLLPKARLRTAPPTQQNTPTQKREAQTTVFPRPLRLLVTQEGKSSQKAAPAPSSPFFPDPAPASARLDGVEPQEDPKGIARLPFAPESRPFQLLPACPQASVGPFHDGPHGKTGQQRPALDPRPGGGEAQRTAWPGVGAQSRSPAWAARSPRHGLGEG
ncbi:unnamed protein product, partial [Gulo gulo]